MAAPDPKTRIMAHMNKEHGADLTRYLQAYNGLSSSAAAGAQLTDLTLDTLTIKSASGVHDVRISPPMKSFADARVRLVEMAERSQEKLGLSDVRVDRFIGARGAGLISFFGVTFYFVSAAALAAGLLDPGSAASAALDTYSPYGAAGFAWLVKAIFIPVVAIHVTEAWWMANTRLAKYGVETGSALWFKWVLQTFLEGVPAFLRFDGLVQEARKKKDAAKH
ncbi:hypothetical protein ANO14919_043090 [Xylariales sp. No.14919]|nr:hypothetical protein ANO14919_043090 [Xylariales sp. No.14919]